MNKGTVACNQIQYEDIISALYKGIPDISLRPNRLVATALMVERNIGIRIGDVMKLRLKDIYWDGICYKLDITEQKTKKHRGFTVPEPVYQMLRSYADEHGIDPKDRLFPRTVRCIQKHLKRVCDYYGFRLIGSHSFRKQFATVIYQKTKDIELTKRAMQHSSSSVTARYIKIYESEINRVLNEIVDIRCIHDPDDGSDPEGGSDPVMPHPAATAQQGEVCGKTGHQGAEPLNGAFLSNHGILQEAIRDINEVSFDRVKMETADHYRELIKSITKEILQEISLETSSLKTGTAANTYGVAVRETALSQGSEFHIVGGQTDRDIETPARIRIPKTFRRQDGAVDCGCIPADYMPDTGMVGREGVTAAGG